MQLEQQFSHKVPQNRNHLNASNTGSGIRDQVLFVDTITSTPASTLKLNQANSKDSIISNFVKNSTYIGKNRGFNGSRRSVEIKRPTIAIRTRLSAGDLTEDYLNTSVATRRYIDI